MEGEHKMYYYVVWCNSNDKQLVRAVSRKAALALFAKSMGIVPSTYLHCRKATEKDVMFDGTFGKPPAEGVLRL